MKLKFLVTSMILTGAAGSAFAQAQDDSMQAQLDALQAKVAQMQATMNNNAAGTNLPSDNWFKRINVSGLINVDGNLANKSPTTYGVNNNSQTTSSIQIPNANVFIDANVSDWTKAHVGLVYGQNMTDFNLLRSGAYTYSELTDSDNSVGFDEAYVTLGNFAKSPFYLKVGQQFLPFGDYKPYQDITPSLTQVLSQVNDVAATTGFVSTKGFNGSVFALNGINKYSDTGSANSNTVRNYGASLGFANSVRQAQYNLGVQYLRNMADVTAMRYYLGNTAVHAQGDTYVNQVSALAANADVKYKALDLGLKYVSAMNKFSQSDLTALSGGETVGAKPAAWGVDTGVSFPVLNHDSRFGLGYQGSYQAANIAIADGSSTAYMPQKRYLANYTFNVSKYTDIGLEVRHDSAYGINQGGTGSSANTATARVAVKFA